MIQVDIPGAGMLALEYMVLDVNGTLALDGQVLPGVTERLDLLSNNLRIYLLSADTYGRGAEIATFLGLDLIRVHSGAESSQKRQFVEQLGKEHVVAIGNGANDQEMLEAAALGIVVLGREGLAVASLVAADIMVSTIEDALDLLLNPRRLVATLRR